MTLMAAALAPIIGICGYASAATPLAETQQPVAITFEMVANGQAARCGKPLGALGSDARRATLRDARFYVQDVALIDADGIRTPITLTANDWQNEQVALLDFEDATGACVGGTPDTNMLVSGTVPAGRYTGLAFTVGVPSPLNHTSTELEGAPLDILAMGWSWQAGRKFIKVEIDPEGGVVKADGSRSASWYVHLGSTGCTGNPVTDATISCLRSNRIPLVMDPFDPANQRIELDLAALFQTSRISEDSQGAVGCMSAPDDPECDTIFRQLGLTLDEDAPVKPGRSPIFRVRPKQ
ncbi:metallo-mystery pair system four-Cys motif protein [Lysobacter pythonis]|uniref:Metallo-mystery pair system four-Cys motif protein n=2 Tax=Solilutibacter pythonis TaxID=2483112 RepID=A0A3M2HYT8_9GAMM|nr:metallo-mystery pair system four-Cys motif protein [Lysobacter pythonis]